MTTAEWLRAQVLVTEQPEATTALLMDLCTGGKESGEPGGEWVAKVADFAHLYAERCASPASPIHALFRERSCKLQI